MKFEELPKAGGAPKSASGSSNSNCSNSIRLALAITALMIMGVAVGQALYKYQDENGDWIFTDRSPPAEETVEIRDLPTGSKAPTVTIITHLVDREMHFIARNEYYATVEVILALDQLTNVEYPAADQVMRWILDPRSELKLMSLRVFGADQVADAKFRYIFLYGDPRSQHRPERP